ncbi:hypothetical protein AB0O95_01735 [Rhodoglobus sp. NPDC076762]
MTIPSDTAAHEALDFQAQQLRMILERLNSVRELLPPASIEWRGPAQQLFDAGVVELRRDLARACTLLQSAEHRTVVSSQQMASYVG